MGEPIRRRIERLEQHIRLSVPQFDWSALTVIEKEVCRAAGTELAAGAITAAEAAELCALAANGVPFPYPIRSKPCVSHSPHLRVLIGGTVSRLRWFGFPGHRPLGWERYLYVGPDGGLMRVSGAAVFPATLNDHTPTRIRN